MVHNVGTVHLVWSWTCTGKVQLYYRRLIPSLSLLQETPKPTKQLVEDSFDGNICRCTGELWIWFGDGIYSLSILGYRSILDSMKSFAVDSDEPQVVDIEVIVTE